ncbi:MAG: hypothetical protein KAU48_07595 [Candidatus Thorarchaeota archaeon]|nr:hypothetical protein [Candidatus Thorarchaeota archaeon]
MDLVTWAIVIAGIFVLVIFNYFLNLAPGSDPEDFALGPPQLNITCDCYLNTLFLGAILVVAFSAGSSIFSSRLELYFVGGLAFAVVTIAGIIGRRKRHNEWREDEQVIRRAVYTPGQMTSKRSPVEIVFDEEDDEDFDFENY